MSFGIIPLGVGFFGAGASPLTTTSEEIQSLRASTWCGGKRVNLSWTNPTGAALIRIRRSAYSFCSFVGDPGEDVYSGVPITEFVDGAYSGASATTNAALDENKVYYYTVFWSFTVPSPDWKTTDAGKVAGLSIRDFYALQGDYVYNTLPSGYRRRDLDDARGTNKGKLRDLCMALQCGISLMRGYTEALLLLRDPDRMPAGRVGEPVNQLGLLAAQAADLGAPPEKAFDAAVLRRLVASIVPTTRKKGTPTGVVDFVKLYTGWDCTVDPQVLPAGHGAPVGGVLRYASYKDPDAYILNGTNGVSPWPSGYVEAAEADYTDWRGAITLPSSDNTMAAFVMDEFDTYAEVQSITDVAGTVRVNFTSALAYLRSEITGNGVGGVNSFTLSDVGIDKYPWQFPDGDGWSQPTFGENAFAGMYLLDSAGTLFPIVSSLGYALTVVGNPANGVYSIAPKYRVPPPSFVGRDPVLRFRLFHGAHNLGYSPRLDIRLADELTGLVPWSLRAGGGAWATTYPWGYVPDPADDVVTVTGVATYIGQVLICPSSNQVTNVVNTMTINEWAGYYLIPNWSAVGRAYKILSNTTADFTLDMGTDGAVSTLTTSGCRFAVLSESDAVKYSRLARQLPSFMPKGSRAVIKFH